MKYTEHFHLISTSITQGIKETNTIMKKTTLGLNGRIVIPKSIRKRMNIEEGSPLIITFEKDAVIVRAVKMTCALCGSPLESDRNLRLCDKCMVEAWKYCSNRK